jgi:hypothetical protein
MPALKGRYRKSILKPYFNPKRIVRRNQLGASSRRFYTLPEKKSFDDALFASYRHSQK